MEIGFLYLSHATFVIAELIVYSARGLHVSQLKVVFAHPRPHVLNGLTHTLEGEVLA